MPLILSIGPDARRAGLDQHCKNALAFQASVQLLGANFLGKL